MSTAPHIVIDSGIPYISGVFESCGARVSYLAGREICRAALSDASAVVVRTRTRCDAALLEGTPVTIVATATAGTDHIDIQYCASHGIRVASAPGCNADGVKQYVLTALYALARRKGINLRGLTMGVIGVGQVGSRVADLASALGFRVLRNDPPRAIRESTFESVPLEQVLAESDIVTLHIPLWEENIGFASGDFFGRMKQGSIFINAARGEVVDENALMLARSNLSGLILDVWAGEPLINKQLLNIADIATPHIAGYSAQGKINGTIAVVRAVADHFGIDQLKGFSLPLASRPLALDASMSQQAITEALLRRYDIWADDTALRLAPGSFEALRTNYSYRIDF